MVETIILMRSNMQEVSIKTGIPYHQLHNLYLRELKNNNLVILTINEDGSVKFNEQ